MSDHREFPEPERLHRARAGTVYAYSAAPADIAGARSDRGTCDRILFVGVDSVSWIGAAINLPPENRAVVPATRSFAEHIHIIGEVSHAAKARRDVGLYTAPTAANASVRAELG